MKEKCKIRSEGNKKRGMEDRRKRVDEWMERLTVELWNGWIVNGM